MSRTPTRLLVIGIDAASPKLLDAWISDGTLPHLAELSARGLTGRMQGIEGFFVGATWPSLYTGTSPARHGFHYQIQLVPGTYRLEDRTREAFVEGDPFWRVLSRAGRRVAVLDVPLARPESDLAGVQVVEWGAHDAFFGFSTAPASVAREIEARAGHHPAGASCDASGRGASEYRAFTDALVDGTRRKATWSLDLLSRGGWDLFMQVFTESHCVGHQCWHLHDPAHPAYDPSVVALTGDPLRTVYAAIDRAVGELVAAAGAATCIVFSAHGMAHRYGAHFLMRDLLCALGAAVPYPVPLRDRLRERGSGVWKRLPPRVRSVLSPLRQRVSPSGSSGARASSISVDPERSRCFPLANGLAASGIRFNIAGREPAGILPPGAVEEFAARLEHDLLAIVDEVSGAPLVSRVLRTRDLFQGDQLDALPDLLVEWSEQAATGSTALGDGSRARVIACSPVIGRVEGANDYGRSGEHRPDGWFVAAGSGIRPGRLDRAPSLLDLAPTFTRVLGVDLPGGDGAPIDEIAG